MSLKTQEIHCCLGCGRDTRAKSQVCTKCGSHKEYERHCEEDELEEIKLEEMRVDKWLRLENRRLYEEALMRQNQSKVNHIHVTDEQTSTQNPTGNKDHE